MDFTHLQNKKVVVTGGNKGIGKEIALTFARLGSIVVITGRDEATLLQTENELRKYHNESYAVSMDMCSVKDIEEKSAFILQKSGNIDVLVNNAGVNIAKPAIDITEEDWDRVLDTNLKGLFFLSKEIGKNMIVQKQGKIINIASQMAFVGFFNRASYCSSKGGVVQLTKALAVEWAEHGVRVNSIAPTFIETELTSKMFENEQFKQDVLSRIPLGSLSKAKDVTDATVFLASEFSNFITGETIRVDGGWTAI